MLVSGNLLVFKKSLFEQALRKITTFAIPKVFFMKFLKGSKLYSILTGTCPVCQEESMYKEKNPYKISRLFDMHERCSNCSTKYKMEPSFFFGAMYVSYAVGIAFAFPVFLLTYFVLELSLLNIFLAIVLALIIFLPVIVRLSRNIWVNFFFDYDPEKANTNSSETTSG